MGEDGCESRFQWASSQDSEPHNVAQASGPSVEPPQPSSPFFGRLSRSPPLRPDRSRVRHRTPSSNLSGSVKPLLYARSRNFTQASRKLPKRLSFRLSTTPPPRDTSGPRIWPFDFYADEMDTGFKKCHLESNKHRPVEKVFQDYFHVKFVRSTFYDHRRHWMDVSRLVREQYIEYGHTERGRWSNFIRQEIKDETRRRMGALF